MSSRFPTLSQEDILGRTVAKLLRSNKLNAFRVENRYVVPIDGTQKFTRTVPFAKEALHRQRGDQTTYIVYVLEAILVGPQGLCLPIIAEFCENEAGDETKQDCELKAFYRLADRLKKLFPKLRLMIAYFGVKRPPVSVENGHLFR
jgi:hypothetical protein